MRHITCTPTLRSRVAALAACLALCFTGSSIAQGPAAPPNGPRHVDPRWDAIVHATLIPEPGRVIENATIVMRDGLIVSVAPAGAPPAGARVWDYSGLTVYAGFVEPHVPVDAPALDSKLPGAHWNAKITPERSALDGDGLPEADRAALRKLGFTAAALAPKGGVFRGQLAVVQLDDPAPANASDRATVIEPAVFQELALERTGWGDRSYPGSEMGAIALARQTLSDADWRAKALDVQRRNPAAHEPLPPADALDALTSAGDRAAPPILVNASDELELLRAARLVREFGRELALFGSGTEFRRLDAVAALEAPIIVPLNYPETPRVTTRPEAEAVSLRDLMTWEQAPTNPRRLDDAGALVSLTTDRLKKRDEFPANLRRAIAFGLSEDRALAMLTTNPAQTLALEHRLGRVAPGFLANLVVTDGAVFEKDSTIRDVWVGGARYEINAPAPTQFAGTWDFSFGIEGDASHDGAMTISVSDAGKVSLKLEGDDDHDEIKAREVAVSSDRIDYIVDMPDGDAILCAAVLQEDALLGSIVTPDGQAMHWTARRRADSADADTDADTDKSKKDDDSPPRDQRLAQNVPADLPTPFGAFGLFDLPRENSVVVTNATIWTGGPEGVIERGWLTVADGKITAVGSGQLPVGARRPGAVIDAQGKHVTPGLIDCHSHTGISGGVNEGTQAVTCEVRIQDVINPDDIDFYRQLAGGLTAANQLHGSANPIGGQNSVVKLRWGAPTAEAMRLEGASPGVKFALGENVKQSNWGDDNTTRYPQTRMGVETIMRDRFIAAREYARDMAAYESLPTPAKADRMPPRRDYELDALAEILAGDRLIHCHSYRQDEILMLCRLAQEFGFTIGTFQHVLEGYKVAEAIREVALGASAFSDWWAYKFEVYDAIPYNGAIMHDAGVVVSFNSDSDELARRMNAEAAKAVKYGGVSPEEALKFVTLNPAKQLKIDRRTGSLELGKDADFVIWSGDPLSSLSRCEATYVDGRPLFTLERDAELREWATNERGRIIQKILSLDRKPDASLADADSGDEPAADASPTNGPSSLMERMRADAIREHHLQMLRAGLDPDSAQCGVCGCATGLMLR